MVPSKLHIALLTLEGTKLRFQSACSVIYADKLKLCR